MAESRAILLVADAGPLMALARLELLSLLNRYAASVWVPQAVLDEVLSGNHPEAARVSEAIAQSHLLVASEKLPAPAFDPPLDIGEIAVIRLALHKGAEILMDESAGRAAARGLGLSVIGTLGLLIAARQEGWVARLSPLLRQMVRDGHYLSETLIAAALQAVGEVETN